MTIIKILITMAITGIATLKKWFSAGKYPTGAQFASLIDSFWHKEDLIEINKVKGLPEKLNKKCETSWGAEVQEMLTTKQQTWNKINSSGSFSADFRKCRIVMLAGVRDEAVMSITPHVFEINMSVLREQYALGVERFEAGVADVGLCIFYMTSNDFGYVACRVVVLDPEVRLINYSIEVQDEPHELENEITE